MTLNNRTIASAPEGAVLWDETVKGLHLRVRNRRKAFYLYYRNKFGQERRPKVGDFGTITLEQARGKAKEWAAIVALGGDPVAERIAEKGEPTVRHLCAKYLWSYVRRKKKSKGRREDRRMINSYVIPEFGKRKVKAIEYGDISTLHAKLARKPVAANRLLALQSKMFNLAESWKFRAQNTNPCRHVERYSETKRRQYLNADELARVSAVLNKYEATRPQAVLFIYLLILSGARPDEIARAKPSQVEPRPIGGVLRLGEHKTDRTGKERLVYLSPHVMDLLKKAPGTNDSLTGIRNPKSLWELVRKEADIPHRMYDLRHTYASVALKSGYTLDQVGGLLGHETTQTTKGYAHLMDEFAQSAAAETAAVLERMMNPQTPTGTISNTLEIGTK